MLNKTLDMNPDVKELKEENKKNVCGFCHRSEINSLMWGPMYQYKGITVHYFCMLFSAGLDQMGDDEEGIQGFLPPNIRKEFDRGKKLRCKFCRQPTATVGCSVKKCKASFHYPCGLENGSLFQFIGNYEAYCRAHKVHTPIPVEKELWEECPLCTDPVTVDENPLFPPCCKSLVIHRKCVMEMAFNSGSHFFKCPFCNDKEEFSEAMRKSGVYLPDRDAAWEMEPGAFEDQTRHYSRCDHEPCLCPEGREYASTKLNKGDLDWQIVRCGACGAAAVHKRCGDLQHLSYRCPTCKSVLLAAASGSDSEADEEELQPHQHTRHRAPRNRQSDRILRRRYDSSSSGDEEPVKNITELLGQKPDIVDNQSSESDSDENCVQSGTGTETWESITIGSRNPNFVRELYGKNKYKEVFEDDGVEDSEEDEDYEDEGQFIVNSSAKTVSMIWKSVGNINLIRKFRVNLNRKRMIKTNGENLHPDARSQRYNKLDRFKMRLDKLRNLYAQIPKADDSLETNENDSLVSQVRTGLVEVYYNKQEGESLNFLKDSVNSVKAGPSNRLLRSSAVYPPMKAPEKIPGGDSLLEKKLAELFMNKLEKLESKLESPCKDKVECESKMEEVPVLKLPMDIKDKLLTKFKEGLDIPVILAGTPSTSELKVSKVTTIGMPSTTTQLGATTVSKKSDQKNFRNTGGDALIAKRRTHNYKNVTVEGKEKIPSVTVSRLEEKTPQKNVPAPGSSKTPNSIMNKQNPENDDEPQIIRIKTPSKSNMRQPKIDSVFHTDGSTATPELADDTKYMADEVSSSGTKLSSILISIQEKKENDSQAECTIIESTKNTSPEKANTSKNCKPNQQDGDKFILLSDSDDDCFIMDDVQERESSRSQKRPISNCHKAAKSESAAAEKKDAPRETNNFQQIDEDDDIQIEVIKLVIQNEKTVEPSNSHHPVPVATAFLQFTDQLQCDKKVHRIPPKYFSGNNTTPLSKAFIANTSAMSRDSQKMLKIQRRETKTGSGFDNEIVILDSSDEEEGSAQMSSSSRMGLRSSDNCGEIQPLPNRDENGNTGSKRERAASSDDLDGSGSGMRSKRPRVAEILLN